MNILLYANEKVTAANRLQNVIEAFVNKADIDIYRTLSSFALRLRRSKYNVDVIVLLAASKKEFLNLLSLRNLLDGIRIILILPDRKPETISKGHKLYPRFVSFADDNFEDVGAVLGKMLEHINEKQKIYRKEESAA